MECWRGRIGRASAGAIGHMLQVTSIFWRRLKTLVRPLVRATRAIRLFFFPTHAWRFYVLNRVGSFLHHDPLMFMKREHYLSRFFGVRQRINNVLFHYQHELRNFDEAYRM